MRMPVKSSTAFRTVQFHFETTMMQLTLTDFTRQHQGRSCLGTKPELSYREEWDTVPRLLQQWHLTTSYKLFAFSLIRYRQFEQQSSY